MIFKNVAGQGIYLFAFDTVNNVPKTGDAANITGNISKDGGVDAPPATTNPTEIGGGVYWQPLAQAETNCNNGAATWSSTTAGVQIDPVFFSTDNGALTNNVPQGGDVFGQLPAHFAALLISAGGHISNVDALSSAEESAIATALLDLANGVETSFTVRQAMRLMLSALAGKVSGAAGTTVTIRDVNDAVNRIVATVDANGNRTAMTYVD